MNGNRSSVKNPLKLVAVETHPIQYKAPLFRALASDPRFDLTVWFAMIPDQAQQGVGFGVPFVWDLPLLDGYRYEVLENRAKRPSVTRFDGCDTPGIYAKLKREHPDVVLVNGWVVKTCLQTLWACRRLGIPCLVRGEANLLRPRAWWKHAIHRLLLSQYRAYLYIGDANRAFYRFHGCPEDRLFFAPYSVDNEYFAREASSRRGMVHALKKAFGISSDACVFLFVGKLEAKKRPMDIITAIASLPADLRSRAHLLMVGEGPLRASLEDQAQKENISASFAGFLNQSRIPDAYAVSDVLVLPSDAGETWGLVVNEAMASGLPAVVSRAAGCCADLVIEGQTGCSFPVGDTLELSRILAQYVRKPDGAASQGLAATRHIEKYSFRQVAEGLAAALAAVGPPSRN